MREYSKLLVLRKYLNNYLIRRLFIDIYFNQELNFAWKRFTLRNYMSLSKLSENKSSRVLIEEKSNSKIYINSPNGEYWYISFSFIINHNI